MIRARVEQVDHRGQARSPRSVPGFGDRVDHHLVAVGDRLGQQAGAERGPARFLVLAAQRGSFRVRTGAAALEVGQDRPRDRRPRGIGLQVAASAAAADAAVGVDDQMADLAGRAGRAGDELAAVDDRPADPGADEDAEEAVDPLAGAEAGLPHRRDLDIVAERGRHAEALAAGASPSAG